MWSANNCIYNDVSCDVIVRCTMKDEKILK